MHLHRLLRRGTAWIALLAVCFGALAPALSQLTLQARGADAAGWVQVCSASGITWVRSDGGDAGGDHPADGALVCPWGVINAGAAGMPPVHAFVLPEAGPQAEPRVALRLAPAAAPRLHAPARAPPVVV